MTKLQDKAQAQVKQMVGQMIGDDKLVQEGREQQHKADEAGHAVNGDVTKEKDNRVQPAGPGSGQKR
jgi:uncharacterized protein YjbJ (UPF0337 family)